MNPCTRFAATLLTGLALAASARAGAPELISYQGVLLQSGGIAVQDSVYDLNFRLYPQESGGTHVFDQTLTVQVTNGLYNVILSNNPGYDLGDVVQAHSLLYMQVTILADPAQGIPSDVVLQPRQQLASVPYALSAGESSAFDPATMHDMATGGQADQRITATKPSWERLHDASSAADLSVTVQVPTTGSWMIEVSFVGRLDKGSSNTPPIENSLRFVFDDGTTTATAEFPPEWYPGSFFGIATTRAHRFAPALPGRTYTIFVETALSSSVNLFYFKGQLSPRLEAIVLPYGS